MPAPRGQNCVQMPFQKAGFDNLFSVKGKIRDRDFPLEITKNARVRKMHGYEKCTGGGGGGEVERRVTSDRPSSLSGKVALSPVVLCYQDKDKLWLLVVHLGVLLRS